MAKSCFSDQNRTNLWNNVVDEILGDEANISFSPSGIAKKFVVGDIVNVDFNLVAFKVFEKNKNYLGSGGLVSTFSDYSNFCQMLVNEGEFKGNTILSKESFQLMLDSCY